jgi:hypothetical protein
MKDIYTNRLDSFRTTLTYLDAPANKAVWFNQSPTRFTNRVAAADTAVTDLAAFCRRQETILTGHAQDKAREEAELEDAAYALGLAVAECARSLGNETDAAKAEFSLSTWREMRDATLLATARQVILLAQGLLSSQATAAGECGISNALITSTGKEADDFEAVINAPQGAIAGRKALTALMRDRFNAVEALFTSLDNLVVQFRNPVFVKGYQAARITRDLGHGPGDEPAPPTLPTPV